MRFGTLALAAVGTALVTVSWSACGAMYSDERLSGRGMAVCGGALLAGAVPLALGVFRSLRRAAWPSEEQAMGIAAAGMLLGLGSAGVLPFVPAWPPRFGEVLGAVFFVGLALTVGGLMLLAWASAARDDQRR